MASGTTMDYVAERIQQLSPRYLQDDDVEYLSAVNLDQISEGDDVQGLLHFLKLLQAGLSKTADERNNARSAHARAEQLLTEANSSPLRRTPDSLQPAVQLDVVRARDQHILYLQYEISQRDLQLQQRNDEVQQARQEIELLRAQRSNAQEEVQNLRGQIARANAENESLRQSIDSQMRHVESRSRGQERNDELARSLEESSAVSQENQRLRSTFRELEDRLREATVELNEAADERIALQKRLRTTENMMNEMREDGVKGVATADRALKPTASSGVQTEKSDRDSDTQHDLDALIGIVNKRVDEWKELLRRQDQAVPANLQSGLDDDTLAEIYGLLRRRNAEVDNLKNNLAAAVLEIEEAARVISELKMSARSVDKNQLETVRNELSRKSRDVDGLQRRVENLEDDLDAVSKENRTVTRRMAQYEEGVYGLPEALAEAKDLRRQLEAKDSHIRDLVGRLNTITANYDAVLAAKPNRPPDPRKVVRETEEMRNDREIHTDHVTDRLTIRALQRQVDQLEEDRSALRSTVQSMMRDSSPAYRKKATQFTRPDAKGTEAERLQDELPSRKETVEELLQENRQLETSMREILLAVRESRVRGRDGQNLEIRVPTLEKLLAFMESRSRGSPVKHAEREASAIDSAVYSEAGDSYQNSLKPKISRLLVVLDSYEREHFGADRSFNQEGQRIREVLRLCLRNVFSVQMEVENAAEDILRRHMERLDGMSGDLARIERQYNDLSRLDNQKSDDLIAARRETATLGSENANLRDRLASAGARLDSTLRENAAIRSRQQTRTELVDSDGNPLNRLLDNLGNEHRREMVTLTQISADLRGDVERREMHLTRMRDALQMSTQQIVNLSTEVILRERTPSVLDSRIMEDLPREVSRGGAEDLPAVGDDAREGNHQRVVATLEAKITRLKNELTLRNEEREREQHELREIRDRTTQYSGSLTELSKQVEALTADLAERDTRATAATKKLNALVLQLEDAKEVAVRRENDFSRERNSMKSQYDSAIARLQDQVRMETQQGVSCTAAPDSNRTFVRPASSGRLPLPASSPDRNQVEKMKASLRERDAQLQKLGAAFQKFKDEMLNFPPPDQTAMESLTTQIRDLQSMLDASQESHMKLTGHLRKARSDEAKAQADAESLKIEIRRRDAELHRYQDLNGELSQRVNELEFALDQAEGSQEESVNSVVPALRQKIADLEKSLATTRANGKTIAVVKPEVLQWEERKKWEKQVEKLREKIKSKDSSLATLEQSTMATKEALARSERERAVMERKILVLSKNVAEATQQPAFLQKALDESYKEIERLKTVIEKHDAEQKRMRFEVKELQKRESNHLAALEDLNQNHRREQLEKEKLEADIVHLTGQLDEAAERERAHDVQFRLMGRESHAELPLQEIVSDPRKVEKTLNVMKAVINESQDELVRIKKLNHTLKTKVKKLEEEQFNWRLNIQPADAALDTKKTLNDLVNQNNRLQEEMKKSKDDKDQMTGRMYQMNIVKDVLEKRVLEVQQERDEIASRRHPEVKAIERQVENKIWDLTAEAEKWKTFAMSLKHTGSDAKDYQMESYEKALTENIRAKAEVKRLKRTLADKEAQVVKMRKKFEGVDVEECKELPNVKDLYSRAEKRIRELEEQICNILGQTPRDGKKR